MDFMIDILFVTLVKIFAKNRGLAFPMEIQE
jgi:hypothetical protein